MVRQYGIWGRWRQSGSISAASTAAAASSPLLPRAPAGHPPPAWVAELAGSGERMLKQLSGAGHVSRRHPALDVVHVHEQWHLPFLVS